VFAHVYGLQLTTLVEVLRVLFFVAPPLVALFTYVVFRRRAQRWLSAS